MSDLELPLRVRLDVAQQRRGWLPILGPTEFSRYFYDERLWKGVHSFIKGMNAPIRATISCDVLDEAKTILSCEDGRKVFRSGSVFTPEVNDPSVPCGGMR